MKIFISWSEPRSRAAARALRDWIQGVFQNVEPWMSEKDIRAGAMWLNEIMSGLKEARFGIVCITPENQFAPWLHFEAGAIAKQVDNTNYVCPYLISLPGSNFKDNPLTHFQYKRADEQGTRELVESINELIEKPLEKDVLDQTFNLWWPKLRDSLASIPEPETKPEVQRSSEDMVTEVLETVRRIDNSIAGEVAGMLNLAKTQGVYVSPDSKKVRELITSMFFIFKLKQIKAADLINMFDQRLKDSIINEIKIMMVDGFLTFQPPLKGGSIIELNTPTQKIDDDTTL